MLTRRCSNPAASLSRARRRLIRFTTSSAHWISSSWLRGRRHLHLLVSTHEGEMGAALPVGARQQKRRRSIALAPVPTAHLRATYSCPSIPILMTPRNGIGHRRTFRRPRYLPGQPAQHIRARFVRCSHLAAGISAIKQQKQRLTLRPVHRNGVAAPSR